MYIYNIYIYNIYVYIYMYLAIAKVSSREIVKINLY